MLRKLAKDATSPTGSCPAVYVDDEDLAEMVAQGRPINAEKTAELEDLATDETAVRLPTETVLRAAGRLLAEHGRPTVAEEIEAFLNEQEQK